MDIHALEVGLHLATSNTRSSGVRLVYQRSNSKKYAALFSWRHPYIWTALPNKHFTG